MHPKDLSVLTKSSENTKTIKTDYERKTMKMTISQLLFNLSRQLLLFTYHPRFEIYKAKTDGSY